MEHTKELHVLSRDLAKLKRTLYPLYNVINELREYCPPARRSESFGHSAPSGSGSNTHPARNPMSDWGADISPAARVYFSDVADHVLILTEEIDMLKGTLENMINMIPPFPFYELM